jgi:hypothetical protein
MKKKRKQSKEFSIKPQAVGQLAGCFFSCPAVEVAPSRGARQGQNAGSKKSFYV